MRSLVYLLFLVPTLLFGQGSKKDSLWLPFQPFIGEWKGNGGGEPGNGAYERSYQFVLGKNFIEVKNQSTYPPTKQHPKGEVHEDIGYFSYDSDANKFKLRQFHTEGFVNEYVLDSISPDQKTIVFVTEAIENIPIGWKARETYRILDDGRMEETFELAEPNGGFELYSKVELVRKK